MKKYLPTVLIGLSFSTLAFSAVFSGIKIKKIEGYWTAERLKNAKAMTFPKALPNNRIEIAQRRIKNTAQQSGEGAPPQDDEVIMNEVLYYPDNLAAIDEAPRPVPQNRGNLGFHFTSSRLVPLEADLVYPYRTVGKLFFTDSSGADFICSASVLQERIVVTAGHCVHKGSGGDRGYYSNFLFVPAHRDGIAPFKSWKATYAQTTSSWASGLGLVPNSDDYAMLEIEDQSIGGVLKKIGKVTGYLGYKTQALMSNHAHLLGYPCNLDKCEKIHQVTAQSGRQIAPNNVEYGSDMQGGSSGGPWVQNFGVPANGQTGGSNPEVNKIIGVTSYGYSSANQKAQGASILNSNFTDLLNSMCGHQVGNCLS